MPVMGGPELAKRAKSLMPGIKVVYMSGYTDDTLAFYGLPQPDTEYIQKPFTPAALSEKVRQVLSTVGGTAKGSGSLPGPQGSVLLRKTDQDLIG